jgi:hypothetical protein
MTEFVQANSLAEFMGRRGRKIVECCGVLWHSVGCRFYMSLPYAKTFEPDPAEVGQMLRSRFGMGVRFPSRTWPGLESGAYFCRRKDYDIKTVHPKHRPRVCRGLETFRMREVTADELLTQGLELNRDTMMRQKRYDQEFGDSARWRRLVEAIRHCPGITAVGAFKDDRLAAYMLISQDRDSVFILNQMSRQTDLRDFPNHALTFHVTTESLRQPHIDSVCYGFTSLVDIRGLHEYKLRFAYEVDLFHSVFLLHPLVTRALRSLPARTLLHAMRGILPGDQRLERIESVLEGARLSCPTVATS